MGTGEQPNLEGNSSLLSPGGNPTTPFPRSPPSPAEPPALGFPHPRSYLPLLQVSPCSPARLHHLLPKPTPPPPEAPVSHQKGPGIT